MDSNLVYDTTNAYYVVAKRPGLWYVSNENGLFIEKPPIIPGLEEYTFDFISVFPNPFKDVLMIELAASKEAITVEILDLDGRMINARRIPSGRTEIDLSKLRAGVYYLKFEDERGNKDFRKIVKQH